MRVAVGTYTGTGSSQGITGVGFQPSLVIVKSKTSDRNAIWKATGAQAASAASRFVAIGDAEDLITSLDADGFTVSTSADTNASGQTYIYIAFNANGNSDIATGSYTGTGADNLQITGLGFTPDFVWIKEKAAARPAVFRHNSAVGDVAWYFIASNGGADRIQQFVSGGFEVGTHTDVNVNGSTYMYVAMKQTATPPVFKQGTYTGNATDGRSITGVGFQPEVLLIKNDTTETDVAVFTTSSSTSDETHYINDTSDATDRIQALESDGFQIGTAVEVNTTGDVYMYMAWNKTADQTTTSTSSSTTTSSSTSTTSTSSSTTSTSSSTTSTSTSTTSTSSSSSTTTSQSTSTSTSTTTTSTTTTSTTTTIELTYSVEEAV